MNKKILSIAQITGAVLVFGGAFLKLLEYGTPTTYIFSAGAFILIVVQFIHTLQARKEEKRIQRLNRLLLIATAVLGLSAYMMFAKPYSESWVVMVLLYAVLSVFLSFRTK